MSTAVLKISSEAGQVIIPTGQPRFIIGRARNADYVIPDSRVSRQHLMIEETDYGWAVRDVSSNGTWLDGSRMLDTVQVRGETPDVSGRHIPRGQRPQFLQPRNTLDHCDVGLDDVRARDLGAAGSVVQLVKSKAGSNRQ